MRPLGGFSYYFLPCFIKNDQKLAASICLLNANIYVNMDKSPVARLSLLSQNYKNYKMAIGWKESISQKAFVIALVVS